MSNEEVRADFPSDSSSISRIRVIKFNHTWTIENFSFFLDKKVLHCPMFSAGVSDGIQWHLKLYPRGYDEKTKDYISLFLNLSSSAGCEVRAEYEVSVLSTEQKTIKHGSRNGPRKFVPGRSRGWPYFMLRDTLFTYKQGYLPDGKLTVHCKISYAIDTENVLTQITQNPSKVPGCVPEEIFGELVESQALSDVVLEVNGKEFRAHKAILAARSPVFKAMFKQDLAKEARTWRIKISDMDEESLLELLRFIYTGESEALGRMTDLLATVEKQVSKHSSDGTALVANPSHENSAKTTETAEQSRAANVGTTETFYLKENSREDQSTRTDLGEEQHSDYLPLESLKKFNGDEAAFYGWWRDFRANVHDRRDLSFGQKLTHLKTLLEGEAAKAIQGAAHDEAKYLRKLGSLFIRFGSVGAMPIDMVLRSLEMSKHSSITKYGLLIGELESRSNSARILEPEKIGNEEAGSKACVDRRSISVKSPTTHRLNRPENVSEKSTEDRFDAIITDAFKRSEERSTPREDAEVLEPVTTSEKLRNSCSFCELPHSPSECQSALTAEQQEERLDGAGFCVKYLSRDYFSENCTSQVQCCRCNGNHHSMLCVETSQAPIDSRDDDGDASVSSFDFILDSM